MSAEQKNMIEQLYLEMYDLLFAYGRDSLQSDSLAEEAIQETFRIACMKPDELLASPNPKGWLVNTLKNVIRSIHRSLSNANKLINAYAAAHGAMDAATEEEIGLTVTYGDLAQTEEFKLIKETAVDGKSYLEMAQARGISIDTCRKRVQRAKEFLRRII